MNEEIQFKIRVPMVLINLWGNRTEIGRKLLKQLAPNLGSVVLALVLFWAASANAAPWSTSAQSTTSIPLTINYQGRLADPSGTPIDNTNPGLGITFSLYNSDSGGTALWSETHASVPISEGLFSVQLGSVNSLNVDLLNGERWLGIQVGTDPEMTPREKLNSVPYAIQAGIAQEAFVAGSGAAGFTITDTIGSASFNQGRLELVRQPDTHDQAGNITMVDSSSDNSWHITYRNDNIDFKFHTPSTGWPERVRFYSNGDVWVQGSISNGAIVENNLQTPDELASDTIDRFSEGDVLCWGDDRLELCDQAGDPLVQAVADENGKPIVIGAEVIHVLGPVQRGDLLVASDAPGYAMVDNNPQPGSVIAQALEDFDGEQGIIRAMIRKF